MLTVPRYTEKPRCGHLTCEQSDSSFHTELLLCQRIGFLARFTRRQQMETSDDPMCPLKWEEKCHPRRVAH